MPRNPVPVLIAFAALIALVGAYTIFQVTAVQRYRGSRLVLASRSELKLSMTVRHADGPIAEEDYVMSDIDGTSSSRYRAVGRSGLAISIDEIPRRTTEEGPNVAYFFQQTVQDGIWDLTTRPARGDRSTSYTVYVYQLAGTEHGSRTISFTDPHYWATTGGHQYHITLSKDKPVPDLLTMSSTTLVEPRYEKIVEDFRTFGPDSFRQKIAVAQNRLKAHG